jgi:hypothetical protein
LPWRLWRWGGPRPAEKDGRGRLEVFDLGPRLGNADFQIEGFGQHLEMKGPSILEKG